MSRRANVPRELRLMPFRGSDAVERALLTRSQLRGRTWRRLLPDIYIAADAPMDHRMWCHAALLYADAGRQGLVVISGYSALHAWGIDLMPLAEMPVEVTVPHGVTVRSRPPYLVVRHGYLGREDCGVAGILRTTSPLRTAFDLARRLDRVEAVVVLDALIHRRLVAIAHLSDYVINHPALPGGGRVTEALSLVEPLTESPMETRTRLRLVDGGLPRPVAQYEVRDARGRFIGRVDLAYPKHRIGIEYEGDHHRDRATFRADVTRGNTMRAAGWTIIRVTYADISPNADKLVADIKRLIARDES